jgi:hypothetical protein
MSHAPRAMRRLPASCAEDAGRVTRHDESLEEEE